MVPGRRVPGRPLIWIAAMVAGGACAAVAVDLDDPGAAASATAAEPSSRLARASAAGLTSLLGELSECGI